jgi:predicted kinase
MADVEHSEPDTESRQLLLLISGLPAVGKSSVVAELAPRLKATQLSRDQVRRSARPLRRLVDLIAFRVLRRRLASVQRWATAGLLNEVDGELRAGRSVIVEALAEPQLSHELSQLATAAAARFVVVECRCGNRLEYERRLATRPKHWIGLVRRLAETHESAPDALRVDTSGSPARSADSILAAIAR